MNHFEGGGILTGRAISPLRRLREFDLRGSVVKESVEGGADVENDIP